MALSQILLHPVYERLLYFDWTMYEAHSSINSIESGRATSFLIAEALLFEFE